ncbi:MAG: ATP-binding protein, partial [Candidatus Thiodiazotropha sp. 6PDIVS]
FDLHQVINTAIHWVVKAAREQLEVECDLRGELQITGRQGQVHQILINLLQNAIDVMEGEQKPRLTIRCVKDKESALVSVKDEGTGIPKQDLKKI